MATIDDLGVSITQLLTPQVHDHIRTIRERRRFIKPKKKTTKRTASKAKKQIREQDIFASVKGMSDDMRAELARKLTGG